MKKSLFIIAGAALILSSCMDDTIRQDINTEAPEFQQGISFETFAQKATRAENSSASAKKGLENYHDSFKVWGSKYVGASSDATVVFNAQQVNANASGDWTYTPIRFWDKSADMYDFYAAAPAGLSWTFDNTAKKISLNGYSVDGASLEVSSACSADAVMPNSKDIMISTDVVREGLLTSKNYGEVNLEFNHILSRLNIAVQKDGDLDEFIIKLKKVIVDNMKMSGNFNEALASGTALASGSVARWTNLGSADAFGYTASGDGLELTTSYKYVHQGLVIPQSCAYQSIKLDGTSSTENPFLEIAYTICDASGDAIAGGDFDYFYNLADIFNGKGSASGDAVKFCEGWMNTLKININPDKIEFCPEVFEWAATTAVEVDVPDINK